MKIHYHSDHLGSASFVTNIDGYVMQHLQYLPYGELFVSQRISEFDSRYKFTAKELDNETSYTYFGARYYDSELSGWLSVDAYSSKYPSISPYIYAANNPVKIIDPNGDSLWINGNNGEKFLYTPGQEYKGSDEFIAKTTNTLNESIGKSKTANRMIGELSTSEYNYSIKQGIESKYTPDRMNQTTKKEWQTNEIFYQGGGVIEWNIYGFDVCEQSKNYRGFAFDKRSNIELLHELAHAWDNMAGLYAHASMMFNGFYVVDLTALRTENIIRKEMGLPLRLTETYNIFDGVKYPTLKKIIDSNGNFIFDKYQH